MLQYVLPHRATKNYLPKKVKLALELNSEITLDYERVTCNLYLLCIVSKHDKESSYFISLSLVTLNLH